MKPHTTRQEFLAAGCGAKMTALRPLRIPVPLLAGVAVGLVTGVRAPTTPTGLAYLVSPRASSRSITPTVLACLMSRQTPKTLTLCLVSLSS